jgi:hypothetical protein
MQKLIINVVIFIIIVIFFLNLNHCKKFEYNYCYIKIPIASKLKHKWIHTNHNSVVIESAVIVCDKCNHNIEIGSNISEVTDK